MPEVEEEFSDSDFDDAPDTLGREGTMTDEEACQDAIAEDAQDAMDEDEGHPYGIPEGQDATFVEDSNHNQTHETNQCT